MHKPRKTRRRAKKARGRTRRGSSGSGLLEACVRGNLNAIRRELKHGNINVVDDEGYTPLFYVMFRDNDEMIDLLLSKKPNLEIETPDGTALEYAYDNENPELIAKIVKAGANLDKQYERGKTLLHKAGYTMNVEQVRNPAKYKLYEKIALALMRPGMRVNIVDGNDQTQIDVFLTGGYDYMVKELLYNAASGESGNTNLAFAKDVSDTKYIFSQRGASCGPDAFFTFLLLSDATRPAMKAAIPSILNASSKVFDYGTLHDDLLARAVDNAVMRYVALKEIRAKALEEAKDTRIVRKPSPKDACDYHAMKKGILNDKRAGEHEGIQASDVERVSRTLFTDDKYELFGRKNALSFFQFDVDDDVNLDKLRSLDLDKLEGIYVGMQPILSGMNIYAASRLGASVPSGHAIAFFKYKGAWVLSDNETGLLHVFKDQAFVKDVLLPALKEDITKIKIAVQLVYHSLNLAFQVDATPKPIAYPALPAVLKHAKWKYSIGSGVIFTRA
jgi:hypothetical protein